jgi:hypothetical protein
MKIRAYRTNEKDEKCITNYINSKEQNSSHKKLLYRELVMKLPTFC